jgi:hypothetical protein
MAVLGTRYVGRMGVSSSLKFGDGEKVTKFLSRREI